MAAGTELELRMDELDWECMISFEYGMPVTLGGTLRLSLADGAAGENLVGRTFDLFNWNAPLAADSRFDAVASLPGFIWDTSALYTTGEVALTAIPEPATLGLLALGALALIRRKKIASWW